MKKKESLESSRFVSPFAILFWLIGAGACFVWKKELPAGLLLFLGLFSGCVRFWGTNSMKDTSLNADVFPAAIYPGGKTEFRYEFSNNKMIPLPWVEIAQDFPEDCCVAPEMPNVENITKEGPDQARTYRSTFSFIHGYETICFTTVWVGIKRGLYRPEHFLARSGDGFGLMQTELFYPENTVPTVAVWPEKVDVDTHSFFLPFSQITSSHGGWNEDPAIIRGMRNYTPTDNRKRINRRMEAKNPDNPQVNLYETVQPGGILFVLDGESFASLSAENPLLEEALKTLGALLTDLSGAGVSCGLLLPRSAHFSEICLAPDDEHSLNTFMYYLAGYACCCERNRNEDGSFSNAYLPSHFSRDAAIQAFQQAASIYIITAEPASLPETLRFPSFSNKTTILSDNSSQRSGDYRQRSLSAYRR